MTTDVPAGGLAEARRHPTINDVAAKAGVSKSLVSLVMRGSPRVSVASREAVLEAAEQLGYRPNAVARSLVLRRTQTVGVLVSDLHNPFFAEVIDGILQAASGPGYQALLGTGGRDPEREQRVMEAFAGLRTDGQILLSPAVDTKQLAAMARIMSLVVVGRGDLRVTGVDTVTNDDAAGAAMAVEYLAALGHRRIAHIAGGDAAGAAERRAGYEAAMRRLGNDDFVQVVQGEYTFEGGRRGALALLEAVTLPTAVFAANDFAAVGALGALEEAGLRVPGDVSLVGYDNSALAALRQVSLTSVNQPRREMGRLAFEALRSRIEGTRRRARRAVLPPTLVRRASSDGPRA